MPFLLLSVLLQYNHETAGRKMSVTLLCVQVECNVHSDGTTAVTKRLRIELLSEELPPQTKPPKSLLKEWQNHVSAGKDIKDITIAKKHRRMLHFQNN